jgi:hypothetical protein
MGFGGYIGFGSGVWSSTSSTMESWAKLVKGHAADDYWARDISRVELRG